MPTTPATFLQNIASAGTVVIGGVEYYAASWNGKSVVFLTQVIGEPNFFLKQAGITVRKVFNTGQSPVIANSYVSKTLGKWIMEFDELSVKYGAWEVNPTRETVNLLTVPIPTTSYVETNAARLSAEANETEKKQKEWDNFFSWQNPFIKGAAILGAVYLGSKIIFK
jgi:hypothetical protein